MTWYIVTLEEHRRPWVCLGRQCFPGQSTMSSHKECNIYIVTHIECWSNYLKYKSSSSSLFLVHVLYNTPDIVELYLSKMSLRNTDAPAGKSKADKISPSPTFWTHPSGINKFASILRVKSAIPWHLSFAISYSLHIRSLCWDRSSTILS